MSEHDWYQKIREEAKLEEHERFKKEVLEMIDTQIDSICAVPTCGRRDHFDKKNELQKLRAKIEKM